MVPLSEDKLQAGKNRLQVKKNSLTRNTLQHATAPESKKGHAYDRTACVQIVSVHTGRTLAGVDANSSLINWLTGLLVGWLTG